MAAKGKFLIGSGIFSADWSVKMPCVRGTFNNLLQHSTAEERFQSSPLEGLYRTRKDGLEAHACAQRPLVLLTARSVELCAGAVKV